MFTNVENVKKQAECQRSRQQTTQETGFTLIEIMIAIVVLTFGLVALMGMSVYVSKANNTSNGLNILAASAQDQVDRLRSVVWTQTSEDAQLAVGGTLDGSYSSTASGTAP